MKFLEPISPKNKDNKKEENILPHQTIAETRWKYFNWNQRKEEKKRATLLMKQHRRNMRNWKTTTTMKKHGTIKIGTIKIKFKLLAKKSQKTVFWSNEWFYKVDYEVSTGTDR